MATRSKSKRKASALESADGKQVHFGNISQVEIESLIGVTSINAKQDKKKIKDGTQLTKRQDRVNTFNTCRSHTFYSPDDLNVFAHTLASSFSGPQLNKMAKEFSGLNQKFSKKEAILSLIRQPIILEMEGDKIVLKEDRKLYQELSERIQSELKQPVPPVTTSQVAPPPPSSVAALPQENVPTDFTGVRDVKSLNNISQIRMQHQAADDLKLALINKQREAKELEAKIAALTTSNAFSSESTRNWFVVQFGS